MGHGVGTSGHVSWTPAYVSEVVAMPRLSAIAKFRPQHLLSSSYLVGRRHAGWLAFAYRSMLTVAV